MNNQRRKGMLRKGIGILGIGLLMGMLHTIAFSEEPTTTHTTETQESAILEMDETFLDEGDEPLEMLEEFMVTKELEGVVKDINEGMLTIVLDGDKEVQLIVDAETLIYINDEKSTIQNVKQGDEIFAYYMEENGTFKCDWIEVTR